MKEKDPNFFVVGVVKGGTTSIYNYLSQHPDVYLTSIKETNHFSDEDMRYEHFEKQYKIDSGLDIKAYLAKESKDLVHIAHVREWSDYLKLYEDVDHEKARGEVCNSYMLCPSASNQIYSAIPKAKIIVILREPVKRMYSQYLMNLREAKVLNRSFREEIEYDRSKDLNGWGVSHNYFALGHYSEQLKRYFDLFGKDKVMVCFFEEFIADPIKKMKEVFSFLGVSNDIEIETEIFNVARKPRFKYLNYFLSRTGILKLAKSFVSKNKREKLKGIMSKEGAYDQISKEDEQFLRDYYSPEIGKLKVLLNNDLNVWGY